MLGLVAIFLALSGTAWEAAKIGAGEIKDDAVRSHHIKDGQVNAEDVNASQVHSSASAAPAPSARRSGSST